MQYLSGWLFIPPDHGGISDFELELLPMFSKLSLNSSQVEQIFHLTFSLEIGPRSRFANSSKNIRTEVLL